MEVKEEVRRMSRKVATLEDILSDFIIITERDNRQLREDLRAIGDRMEADTAKLKAEMSDFKNEMSDFKNEMSEFKNEMSEFKNEMSEFKNEMRASTKDLHKKVGDLSRKLGTFAEDFAAPNLPRIAGVYFQEPNVVNHFVRWTRFDPIARAEMFEADAITETENMVFFLEAKFSPRNDDIKAMPERIKAFRRWFPEFSNKKLVTIFASWSINENHLRMLTKMGVYAMVVGENTMELSNFDALKNGKK
jgi:uncharacterized protein YhaN